jgi:hypothetical protein
MSAEAMSDGKYTARTTRAKYPDGNDEANTDMPARMALWGREHDMPARVQRTRTNGKWSCGGGRGGGSGIGDDDGNGVIMSKLRVICGLVVVVLRCYYVHGGGRRRRRRCGVQAGRRADGDPDDDDGNRMAAVVKALVFLVRLSTNLNREP